VKIEFGGSDERRSSVAKRLSQMAQSGQLLEIDPELLGETLIGLAYDSWENFDEPDGGDDCGKAARAALDEIFRALKGPAHCIMGPPNSRAKAIREKWGPVARVLKGRIADIYVSAARQAKGAGRDTSEVLVELLDAQRAQWYRNGNASPLKLRADARKIQEMVLSGLGSRRPTTSLRTVRAALGLSRKRKRTLAKRRRKSRT
jgi:hypothetical protein